MKKNVSIALTAILAAVLLIFIPTNTIDVSASNLKIEIKEAGSNNTSIANGFFSPSATYTVENGKNYIQLTLNKDAQYVKSLSGPYGAAQVISDSGNTRVLKLQVGDLSQPVTLNMHVVVPEKIAGMKYDQNHTARLVVTEGWPPSQSATNDNSTSEQSSGETVENPPTGDDSSIALYAFLVLASVIALVAVWKFRPARN